MGEVTNPMAPKKLRIPMPYALSVYLDLVRLLSALTVALGHFSFAWISGGTYWQLQKYGHSAVIVFFVLSGFVIAFVSEKKETELASYATARFARIASVAFPALVLTIFLLIIGTSINPVFYSKYNAINLTSLSHVDVILQFLSALFFLNEVWAQHVPVMTNFPYWSLSYEVWYYVIFGCFWFLDGTRRVLWVILACLIAGPKILLMMPIWIAGALAWRYRGLCSRETALTLSICSLALFALLNTAWVQEQYIASENPWLPYSYKITDHYMGLAFAIHLWALTSVFASSNLQPNRASHLIRVVSDFTFPIYLYHMPILIFLSAIVPASPENWWRPIVILALTCIAIVVFGRGSEVVRRAIIAFFKK